MSKILKIFISQPMNGKSDEYIKHERAIITEKTRQFVKEKDPDSNIEVIDSFFTTESPNPVHYLGRSIMKLSEADLAVFSKDWESARGCVIEHTICEAYSIDTFVVGEI